MKKISGVCFLAVLAIASAGSAALAQESVSARGIFFDEGTTRMASEFFIHLVRGEESEEVPTTHKFQSGDKVRFVIKANADCYFYVFNRTFKGNPDELFSDASRGIVLDEEKISAETEYRILYPSEKAGKQNFLYKDSPHMIPVTGQFIFDEEKGIEKVYVVLSKSKVNKLEDLIARLEGKSGDAGGTEGANNEDQEVLNQLMGTMAKKSVTEYGDSKDSRGYSASTAGEDSASDVVITVFTLAHY